MKIVEGYYIPWLEVLLFIGIAVALRWHQEGVESLGRQLDQLQKEIRELRGYVQSLQFSQLRESGTESGQITKSIESVDEDEIPF